MKTKYIIAAAILLVFIAGIAASQDAKKSESTRQSVIEHHLIEKGLLVKNNVQVSVVGNAVTLKGEVPTINAKNQAEQEVKDVDETFSVVSDLVVKFSDVPDSVLAGSVQDRINRFVFYSIFDWITVEADHGAITLKGWGYLPWTAKQIQSFVEKMKDVQKVDNQIQFTQGSDYLRNQVARAIYNDMAFEFYAFQPVPPVHIIVDGANVILEGNVNSISEKNRAETLAKFNSDAVRVVNDITVLHR